MELSAGRFYVRGDGITLLEERGGRQCRLVRGGRGKCLLES